MWMGESCCIYRDNDLAPIRKGARLLTTPESFSEMEVIQNGPPQNKRATRQETHKSVV